MKTIFLFLFLIVVPITSQAQETDAPTGDELDKAMKEAPAVAPKGGNRPQILDFEADVIEGVRKAPQLFLQMEIETPSLDTAIYNRKNFNDFHVVEKDRRPLYQPVPRGK